MDRWVALKLLPESLSADAAFAERFNREARFLARLNHPNIVTIHDFGQSGGFCYLLLEFVDGINLRQAMQAGRFSPAEALAIVPNLCAAIQYAHDQGVLHRDIKPENILLDSRGRVKLADFGIAKLAGEPGSRGANVTLTRSGTRIGTPHYMAPEQIEKPSQVDHRADIYSLGVVFYELLTGELPLGRFAPPSDKADLDARVDAIVFRALAKERELRQQSAGEVKTQVEALGPASTARPPQALLPHEPFERTALPDSGRRLAWLFVLIGALSLASSLVAWLSRKDGFGWFFNYTALLPVTGIALLTRGTKWRIASLATNYTAISIGLYQAFHWPLNIAWTRLTAHEGLLLPEISLTDIVFPIAWSLFGMAGFIAGIQAMWSRNILPAFGIAPSPATFMVRDSWRSHLYWSMLALFSLLVSAVMGRSLSNALDGTLRWLVGPGVSELVGGLLPAATGIIVGLSFFRSRYRTPNTKPIHPFTPWSHFLFWLLTAVASMAVVTALDWVWESNRTHLGLPTHFLWAVAIPVIMIIPFCYGYTRTLPIPCQSQEFTGATESSRFVWPMLGGCIAVISLLLFNRFPIRFVQLPPATLPSVSASIESVDQEAVMLTRRPYPGISGDRVFVWELQASRPALVQVSFGDTHMEFPLVQVQGGNYLKTISVFFDLEQDQTQVMMTVLGGDAGEGEIFHQQLPGIAWEIMAQTKASLQRSRRLSHSTPTWIVSTGNKKIWISTTPLADGTRGVSTVPGKTLLPVRNGWTALTKPGQPMTPGLAELDARIDVIKLHANDVRGKTSLGKANIEDLSDAFQKLWRAEKDRRVYGWRMASFTDAASLPQ